MDLQEIVAKKRLLFGHYCIVTLTQILSYFYLN